LIGLGTLILRLEESQADARTSESLHLFLITLSVLTTLRYWYYRTNYTLNFDTRVDTVFCLLLLLAELYAIATLFLSYFQTLKIKERQPVDLSAIPKRQWYSVDIYIPTYNEDVEIVRKTALGALAIAYPVDKKRVYILDDGRAEKYRDRRQALREMCDELGCTLLTRDNNDHAKAGNINTALKKTAGDLVLILDCDHIPTHRFLAETVGFFFNPKVALVQTPHWFYNPDPFERNLLTRGRIPVGNELFYKVLQKGNDYWNAAFFCGSAAIIRRQYVLEIGGIATETVTEDCHTSLRLHSLGYETVYYDKIMVAGLAPEKFSAYVGQQVRWARGMAQILRLENPLFNRKLKLSLPQRICYFSATSHFFFGFPRLMYVLAPTLYLLLGINSVKGLGLETLFYALPHILLSMQANHIPYKHVRFSFWNEIYEFAMSFQAGIVTLLALVNPKLGSFNVTDKGLKVSERSFDFESVRYLVILAIFTAASLLMIPFWLVFSPQDTQAVLINSLWCLFNLMLLTAACLVAFEQPEQRYAHRMPRQLEAIVHSGGDRWRGQAINVSESGCLVMLDQWPNSPDEVRLELVGDYGARVLLDARVVRAIATDNLQTQFAVHFLNPTRTQLDDLITLIYSDVEEWYSQNRAEADNPFASLQFIANSLKRAFQEFIPEVGVKLRQQVQAEAQLYWEDWDYSYQAQITELGLRDLRLELLDTPYLLDIERLRHDRPLLGLLVPRGPTDPAPQSLLARVHRVEIIPRLTSEEAQVFGSDPGNLIVIELTFPETLHRQQKSKIKQLLRSLTESSTQQPSDRRVIQSSPN
jgi:cellulose synthase (UDP-forming)